MGFYTIIGLATLLGLGIDWSPLDPMQALYWSAVVNGVVAAPIMAVLMVVASRRDQMGAFQIGAELRFFGWAATAIMALACLAMFVVLVRR